MASREALPRLTHRPDGKKYPDRQSILSRLAFSLDFELLSADCAGVEFRRKQLWRAAP